MHASPPQGIVKLDVLEGTEESWIGDADQYLSEPMFAKKKGACKIDFSLSPLTSLHAGLWLSSHLYCDNISTEYNSSNVFYFLFLLPLLSIYRIVPDADEDDGYILSFLSNWAAGETDFVVFDAKNISKGAT